jgi:hypothetical protein
MHGGHGQEARPEKLPEKFTALHVRLGLWGKVLPMP